MLTAQPATRRVLEQQPALPSAGRLPCRDALPLDLEQIELPENHPFAVKKRLAPGEPAGAARRRRPGMPLLGRGGALCSVLAVRAACLPCGQRACHAP